MVVEDVDAGEADVSVGSLQRHLPQVVYAQHLVIVVVVVGHVVELSEEIQAQHCGVFCLQLRQLLNEDVSKHFRLESVAILVLQLVVEPLQTVIRPSSMHHQTVPQRLQLLCR